MSTLEFLVNPPPGSSSLTAGSDQTQGGSGSQGIAIGTFATGGLGTLTSPWTGWETGLTAAIANGVTLHFNGIFSTSTVLVFDGTTSVTLLGDNGRILNHLINTTEGAPVSQLIYTGTAAQAISAQGTIGFTVRGLSIKTTNTSFTGVALNCDGNSITPILTFGMKLDTVTFDVNIQALACLSLQALVQGHIQDTNFCGGTYGIVGIRDGNISTGATSWFSNVLTVVAGSFASQVTSPIRNPGTQWTFIGVYFEPLTNGAASAITSIVSCNSLSFIGCGWFDSSGGTVFSCVAQTSGFATIDSFSVIACYFECASATIFSVQVADGMVVTGCHFGQFCTMWASTSGAGGFVGAIALLLAGNRTDTNFTDNTPTFIANGTVRLGPRQQVGVVTVAVPASGTAVTAVAYDRTFYVTAGASTCTMAIQSGPSPIIPAGAFATIRVPANQTVTPTYTSAPTWVVNGES